MTSDDKKRLALLIIISLTAGIASFYVSKYIKNNG